MGTGVEAVDILPAVLVVAAAKDPGDGVDDSDAVGAHAAVGDGAVDGGATPVHDSRWGRLDVEIVGETGGGAGFGLGGWDGGWRGLVGSVGRGGGLVGGDGVETGGGGVALGGAEVGVGRDGETAGDAGYADVGVGGGGWRVGGEMEIGAGGSLGKGTERRGFSGRTESGEGTRRSGRTFFGDIRERHGGGRGNSGIRCLRDLVSRVWVSGFLGKGKEERD